MKTKFTRSKNFLLPASLILAGATLAGCATEPRYAETYRVAPPPVTTEVYAYPKQGQSLDQQKRDRFECYNWAVKQTGFEPSKLPPDGTVRTVRVEPAVSPNHDATVLGVTGALIGAAVSRPSNALAGAAIGGVVGAAAGSASDADREATAQRIEDAENANQNARGARLEERAAEYRRAMGACLEGRGYTVN
ncbi:MAG TPA: hypothetical protein VFW00_12765 [Rhodocyclaceae bacterium]|nr:hypothetical protein [Rhodocyclaceae bacterium]